MSSMWFVTSACIEILPKVATSIQHSTTEFSQKVEENNIFNGD